MNLFEKPKPKPKVKIFEPHPHQLKVLKGILSNKAFFNVLKFGRQYGKSHLINHLAIYYALEKPNRKIWFLLPSDKQTKSNYTSILNTLSKSVGLIKSKRASAGEIEIKFKNGSIIQFKSALAEHNLRGDSVNILFVDESAFIKRSLIEEIVMPVLTVKGEKMIVVSTPKGKKNSWFYDYYMRGLDKSFPNYMSFSGTSADNPSVNPDVIENARQTISDELFRQEYLGEFIEGSGSVFGNLDKFCIIKPSNNHSYSSCYCGVDLGLKGDSTVVTILDQEGKMIFQEALTNVDAPQVKEYIVKVLRKYKPVKTVVEKNGLGLPIIQDLKQIHRLQNIEEFNTSNTTKSDLISDLVEACYSGKLTLFNDEQLKDEMLAFGFTFGKTGKISYAATGNAHDDRVMSLAFAYNCYKRFKRKQGSYFLVRR